MEKDLPNDVTDKKSVTETNGSKTVTSSNSMDLPVSQTEELLDKKDDFTPEITESVTNPSKELSGGVVNATTNAGSGTVKSVGKGIGAINKIYSIEKAAVNITARTIAGQADGSGDAGKGFSIAKDVAGTGAIIASSSYMRIQDACLKGELKDKFGIHSKVDVKIQINELNKILKKYDIKALNPNASGNKLRADCNILLRKLKRKGINIPELNEALKKGAQIGVLTPPKRRNLKKLRMKVTRYAMKSLKQCDAGQGLALTTTITSRGASALKKGIKAARAALRATRIAGLKAMLLAAKAARKAALKMKLNETKIGKKTIKKTKALKKGFRTNKNKFNNSKVGKGLKKIAPKKELSYRDRIKKKILKKFRKLIFHNPLANRIASTKVFKVASKTLNILGKPFVFLKKIFAFIMNVVKYVVVAILVVIILFLLILMLISAVVNMFNFSASKEDIRNAAINKVNECYSEDLDYISSLSSKYKGGVTIKYEDVKNNKAYKENSKKNKDKKSFYQSTNSAEILSMTLVRFEHDLEKAGMNKVLNYVEQLYHGSHEIVIKESSVGKDKDGNETKRATITYRTYYYNYLFDRQLSDERIEVTNNNDDSVYLTGKNIQDSIYVACRDKGYTHAGACAILGNIECESNFNPTCENSSGYYGLFQWGGGRRDNLKKYSAEHGYTYMSVDGQMAFFFNEVEKGSYKKASDYLKTSKDVNMCTQEFCVGYEGCIGATNTPGADTVYTGTLYPGASGKTYQHLQKRINAALAYAEKYKKYAKDYEKLRGSVGAQVAKLGLTYIGKLHYAWGGRNLDSGCDCSGFVYALYQKFNVIVPSSSAGYVADTSHKVLDKIDFAKMQPGDVIVEKTSASSSGRHVTLYVGNNKIIGSNGNNAGCPQQGASPGGTARPGQKCPNDCGYTHPGNVIGVYRYVTQKTEKKNHKKDNKKNK